jgi:hypothetical protein
MKNLDKTKEGLFKAPLSVLLCYTTLALSLLGNLNKATNISAST